ncbi:MAG: CcoQ/FixQ family Cbb3-type cytochrome c oxidase assembly chaperone [Ignavibacteria bacterium]|nr:CcoQ/FixQ family Cbb3-type cytochrome c oxidase assembly chaperone [Ignavibacteria bacterium]
MYKNVLENIPGIEYYPIVALIFFFGFFVALIVWYFRVDVAKLNREAAHALLDSPSALHSSNVSTDVTNGGQNG